MFYSRVIICFESVVASPKTAQLYVKKKTACTH